MTVMSLDHINIVTADLDRAEAFYRDILGLETRPAPPPLTHDTARWMVDAGGNAVLHLNRLGARRVLDRDMRPGPTGALHHVAMRCAGYDAMVARLTARGVTHIANAVPAAGLRQLFITDPEGIVLELNFFGE